MMKKEYIAPETDVMMADDANIMAGSVDSEIGGNATTPAKTREFYSDWDDVSSLSLELP